MCPARVYGARPRRAGNVDQVTESHQPREVSATRAYRAGAIVEEGFSVDQVTRLLEGDPETIIWVDLCEPCHRELEILAAELSLHELAVEDALGRHQRPKLDYYDTHQFLSIRTARLNPDSGELDEIEIDAFVNTRWIITIRKSERFPIEQLTQRWDRTGNLAAHGIGYLLYGLLDLVVEDYFTSVDLFDEYYDTVSESLFDGQPLAAQDQQHWFRMRKSLVRFHRIVVSMREAVSAIMRREHGTATGEMYPYYQDVYDHVLRITESTESLRDLGATIVETNLALRDYRQNQVTKKITSWAAIIAVPTLVTGYYGMNVPFPGSGETSGVIISTVLAIGIPGILYTNFRRRDWL